MTERQIELGRMLRGIRIHGVEFEPTDGAQHDKWAIHSAICELAVGALNAARAVDGLAADPATANWPVSGLPDSPTPSSDTPEMTDDEMERMTANIATPPTDTPLAELLDRLAQACMNWGDVRSIQDLREAKANLAAARQAIESAFSKLRRMIELRDVVIDNLKAVALTPEEAAHIRDEGYNGVEEGGADEDGQACKLCISIANKLAALGNLG